MTINHIYIDMSKSDNNANQSPEYFLDTSNLTKIWFSNDPDKFMDLVRMDNLRQARRDNPNSKITLVHGDLKGEGLKSMMGFCEHHNITPIHVDKLIEDAGCDELDIEYNNLIRQELKLWREGKGGNPAAASDMLRYTGKILAYSDCDAGIKSDGGRHPMNGPIGIPMADGGGLNNDVMMIGVNQDGTLHPDAAALLRKMREDVVETSKILVKLKQDYQDHPKTQELPFEISLEDKKRILGDYSHPTGIEKLTSLIGDLALKTYLQKISPENEEGPNLPELRGVINSVVTKELDEGYLRDLPDIFKQSIKFSLQTSPLLSHTGPICIIRTLPNYNTYNLQESGEFKFDSNLGKTSHNQLSWVEGQEHRVAKPNQELAERIREGFVKMAQGRFRNKDHWSQIKEAQRQKRFEGAKNFWEKRVHQNPAPPQGRGGSSR